MLLIALAMGAQEADTLNARQLEGINVHATAAGRMKSRLTNSELISSGQLLRAACCNLGESFTANPSVDVNYSDAAVGAKQIRLLGLSGRYVQMLTENVPDLRGASLPYALGYIPGPWMQSIQVSKGCASVKHGYEGITGQINVEYKKPQYEREINGNAYINSRLRYELNADANLHLSSRWSGMLLLHYEHQPLAHDGNGDGFMDMPKMRQWNVHNRWAYISDKYIMQASIKALHEKRQGGTAHDMDGMTPYRIEVSAQRYEAFVKNAYIFNQERNSNIALILSGSIYNQSNLYGARTLDFKDRDAHASLMYETDFSEMHNLSAGLSLNADKFERSETTYGAYAQYTLTCGEKFVASAGIRADRSSIYGFFFTPRAHIKWSPSRLFTLRASAGKGYRTPHPLSEYSYLLSSSRKIIVEQLQQEAAWNYGGSVSLDIPILGKNINLNADFYYTNFTSQMIVDLDSDPHAVTFTNLRGKSRSIAFQLDATCQPFEGFTVMAAYRLTDVKQTIGGRLREAPLTNRYKVLLSAGYKTPLELWQFDVTLAINGGGRLPDPYVTADGSLSWDQRFKAYPQLQAQITREFRHFSVYVGGENLTNFRQKNPIIGSDNPWGENFDSTMTWGPIEGAVCYAGVRINY